MSCKCSGLCVFLIQHQGNLSMQTLQQWVIVNENLWLTIDEEDPVRAVLFAVGLLQAEDGRERPHLREVRRHRAILLHTKRWATHFVAQTDFFSVKVNQFLMLKDCLLSDPHLALKWFNFCYHKVVWLSSNSLYMTLGDVTRRYAM